MFNLKITRERDVIQVSVKDKEKELILLKGSDSLFPKQSVRRNVSANEPQTDVVDAKIMSSQSKSPLKSPPRDTVNGMPRGFSEDSDIETATENAARKTTGSSKVFEEGGKLFSVERDEISSIENAAVDSSLSGTPPAKKSSGIPGVRGVRRGTVASFPVPVGKPSLDSLIRATVAASSSAVAGNEDFSGNADTLSDTSSTVGVAKARPGSAASSTSGVVTRSRASAIPIPVRSSISVAASGDSSSAGSRAQEALLKHQVITLIQYDSRLFVCLYAYLFI